LKILITGGNGYLGSRLAVYLKNQGHEIIIGVRDSIETLPWNFGIEKLIIDWDNLAIIIINRLQVSSTFTGSLGVISQELAAILERYLEEDLEKIVQQAIPILSIDL
jgi:uncharacterized membrane protein YheB (UPF0754 family)